MGGADSLTSLSGGHVMTPSAGALPTYKNSSLVLPAVVTGFNGLSTEYHDSNSMTLAAVIQYTGAATQILLGVFCLCSSFGRRGLLQVLLIAI